MIRQLRRRLPHAQLSILVRQDVRPLLLHLPQLGQILALRKGLSGHSLVSLLRLILAVRRENFDALLCPHKSVRSALIAFFSGIPLRCGYADAALAKKVYHRMIPFLPHEHETVRLIRFMEQSLQLASANLTRQHLIPHLRVRVRASELGTGAANTNKTNNASMGSNTASMFRNTASGGQGQGQLRAYVYDLLQYVDAKRPIALAPSSAWTTKRWTSWHFAFLCDRLIEIYKKEIIILGAKGDQPIVQRFLQFVKIFLPDRLQWIKNHCGKIQLDELSLVLPKCSMLIGNDSAPGHIACAADIPVVSIFGPTHPRFGYAPIGRRSRVSQADLSCRPCCSHGQARCPHKHFRCMKEVSREQVLADLAKIL